MKNISLLKNILKAQKIDYFVLPNSDEFFLEYLPQNQKRIEFISGFSGSNAVIIFGQKNSQFFTDGRYILQSKNELDLKEFSIIDMAEMSVLAWLRDNLKKSQKIAIDSKLMSINFVFELEKIVGKIGAKLEFVEQNPVDEVWKNRAKKTPSEIFSHPLKYAGASFEAKISEVAKGLESDALFLSNSESICWLLNIRAADTEYSPLLASYAILYKTGQIDVFVGEGAKIKGKYAANINFVKSDNIIIKNSINSIEIDANLTNYFVYKMFQDKKVNVILKNNPILIKKAVKNKTEIKNAVKAHEIDGLAVVRFLFWLENSLKKGERIDELSAEEKLLEFRQKNKNFVYPSFRSISGFSSNGAIIHYHSSKKTNKILKGNSLYLIDSGGQYFQGTTDITRTVAVGEPKPEMIHNFTLVLKGHIALAMAKFDEKTTGDKLDLLARQFLLEQGKDYAHGTGHGVGSFLCVHEGPVSISKKAFKHTFKAGMVLSNEPGFYQENEYGIRIENLVLINKIKASLVFETLTLAPIDYKLINFKLLTKEEKKWLNNYHKKIFLLLNSKLKPAEKAWLALICKVYKNN